MFTKSVLTTARDSVLEPRKERGGGREGEREREREREIFRRDRFVVVCRRCHSTCIPSGLHATSRRVPRRSVNVTLSAWLGPLPSWSAKTPREIRWSFRRRRTTRTWLENRKCVMPSTVRWGNDRVFSFQGWKWKRAPVCHAGISCSESTHVSQSVPHLILFASLLPPENNYDGESGNRANVAEFAALVDLDVLPRQSIRFFEVRRFTIGVSAALSLRRHCFCRLSYRWFVNSRLIRSSIQEFWKAVVKVSQVLKVGFSWWLGKRMMTWNSGFTFLSPSLEKLHTVKRLGKRGIQLWSLQKYTTGFWTIYRLRHGSLSVSSAPAAADVKNGQDL